MTAPYQLFPQLPAAVEAALRESIRRFGVLVPVAVDQHGTILDGHHRKRIAAELGVECRVDVHQVADEAEGRAIALTLNSDRRQVSAEQRREVVAALRAQGHSLRAIAGAVGASKDTVARDVAAAGTVAPETVPDRVMGLDGKERPATRPRPVPSDDATTSPQPEIPATSPSADEPEASDEWPPPGWVPPQERVKAMPAVMGARAIEQLDRFIAIVEKAGGPAAIIADQVPGLAAVSNALNWHALRDARDVIDQWMGLLEQPPTLRRVK